jgi:hypothetical protein
MLRNISYERAHALGDSRQQPWAWWLFEPEEWKQFLAKDKARVSRLKRSRFLLILLVVSAFSISVGMMGLLAGGFYGAICLTVVPFIWIVGIQTMWAAWLRQSKIQWYDPRDLGSRSVRILPTFVKIGESTVDLVSPELALTRVWIEQKEPRILRFRTQYLSGRGITNEIWLPVPEGREAEAERLAERFQQEIIRSSDTLVP